MDSCNEYTCSMRQAIEYIAFDWEPETEEGEILNGRNRKLHFNNGNDNLFLIKQAAAKLKQYILQELLDFEAFIYNGEDASKCQEALNLGKISQVEYIELMQSVRNSDYIFVSQGIGNITKELISKQAYWDKVFQLVICEDLSYYIDPYNYSKDSEYDLFYIKTHCEHDIRYLNIFFNFDDLKNMNQVASTYTNNKIERNKYIDRRANELKAQYPKISNNGAAVIIHNELSEKRGMLKGDYPSLQTIRNYIKGIIPPEKKI